MLKNIVILITLYATIQITIMGIIASYLGLTIYTIVAFVMLSCLWHLVLFWFLYAHTKEFFILGQQELLTHINLANKITLLRAASVSLVVFLLCFIHINGVHTLLAGLLAFIFFTDALDGQIARRHNEVTSIGQMLDSMSDYAILTVISIAYWRYGLVSAWFFCLIFGRLALQSAGVFFFLFLRYPLEARSTIGGKLTIAATMCLYVLELIYLLFPTQAYLLHVTLFGEKICATIIFIFIFEKLWIFIQHWKQYQDTKKTEHKTAV